jgi:D-lactate dehydrogenase
MTDLILGMGGSLKAEHGTGRMMAPFVRRQYGDELFEVMRELKRLCDPAGTLNPGVVISDATDAHVSGLKSTPTVDAEVDRCVECGFCEPVCPSRDLTITPRQRIVLRRALQRARESGDSRLQRELESEYAYDGIHTCAAEGMCQTACPVGINTADLVKRLREQAAGAVRQHAWRTAARHWDIATRAASRALDAAAALPPPLVSGPNKAARRLLGAEQVPLWSAGLPPGGNPRPLPQPGAERAAAVYFPACVGTIFGGSAYGGVQAAFRALCERSGLTLAYPVGLRGLCCGTPWRSKGLSGGAALVAERTAAALWEASDHGHLPVVCDATSCTEGLRQVLALVGPGEHGIPRDIQVTDVVEFARDQMMSRLTVRHRIRSVALHPTCAGVRAGTGQALSDVAEAISDEAVVPGEWGCCAFAGDRGLLHPELTAAATAAEAKAVNSRAFDAYASSNRTCEIGMTRATGHDYAHLIELLEWATRDGPTESHAGH